MFVSAVFNRRVSVSLLKFFRQQTSFISPASTTKPALSPSNHVGNSLVKRCSNMASPIEKISFSSDFFFKQLFDRESCTYSYLLADTKTKEAVLIDPVIDLAERDAALIKDLGFNLKYALNTHMHADHITGTGVLKNLLSGSKSIIASTSTALADIHVKHHDTVEFGRHKLEVRETPGHTNGCVTYVCHEQGVAFTGDALLIRGCGRTDFQEGNPETLYNSVHTQIFSLPDNFVLYPAHDYKGLMDTTVWEEKTYNPRLTKSKEQFIEIMNNLNLAYPKQIDRALPANKVCGLYNLPPELAEKFKNILPEHK